MVSWLLRGLSSSIVHIVARVLLGLAIVHSPLHGTSWKAIAVAAVVLVVLIYGGIDGIIDGRAHDDPDDYADLTITWLKAGLLAGAVSGIVSWILSNYVLSGMGQNSFFVELFAGGSFTALLVFVPALVGAALGRFLAHRQSREDSSTAYGDTREHETV